MLLEEIKAASVVARKARDSVRATLLITLYAEAAMVGKNSGGRDSTDDEVVKIVRKFVNGIDETLAATKDEAVRAQYLLEKAILEPYLPQMTSAAELEAAVANIVAGLPEKSPKAMGVVMKALKDKFGASLDGALVSVLVKKALA